MLDYFKSKNPKLLFVLFGLILTTSFQNCGAPGANLGKNNEDSTSSSSSSTTSKDNSSSSVGGVGSGSARNIKNQPSNSGSSSSGGISSGSSSGVSSGGGGGGSGYCFSCSSSGRGAEGSGTAGGSNGGAAVSDGVFKIKIQPAGKIVPEGGEFSVSVQVEGGKFPYKYDWFFNGTRLVPKYGGEHYDSYFDSLDRVHKEGTYHAEITDADGKKLISNKVAIKMNPTICRRGQYWFPTSAGSEVLNYYGDMFNYNNTKYFASQYTTFVSMIQSKSNRAMPALGFSYFSLNADVSNEQTFSIECSTEVPTVHSPVCSLQSPTKCHNYWSNAYGEQATHKYTGGISFTCRNGYLQFLQNSCKLVPFVKTCDRLGNCTYN